MSYYRTFKTQVQNNSSSDRTAIIKSKTIYSECTDRANNGGTYIKNTKKDGTGKPMGTYNGGIYISPSKCLIGAQSYDSLLSVTKGKYLTTPPQAPLENNTFDIWYSQFSVTDYTNPDLTPVVIEAVQGSDINNKQYYDCSLSSSCDLVDYNNNSINPQLIIDPENEIFYNTAIGPTSSCFAKNERSYLQYVDISGNSNIAHNYQRCNQLQGFTYPNKFQFNCENSQPPPWNYELYIPIDIAYRITYGYYYNNSNPTKFNFTIEPNTQNTYENIYIEKKNNNDIDAKIFVYENQQKKYISFYSNDSTTVELSSSNFSDYPNDATYFTSKKVINNNGENFTSESNEGRYYLISGEYYLVIDSSKKLSLYKQTALDNGIITNWYINIGNPNPQPDDNNEYLQTNVPFTKKRTSEYSNNTKTIKDDCVVLDSNNRLTYGNSTNNQFVLLDVNNRSEVKNIKYGDQLYLALKDDNLNTSNPTIVYNGEGADDDKTLKVDSLDNIITMSSDPNKDINYMYYIYPNAEDYTQDNIDNPSDDHKPNTFKYGIEIQKTDSFCLAVDSWYVGPFGKGDGHVCGAFGCRSLQEKNIDGINVVYANHGGFSISLFQASY